MIITEILARNARMYGNETALVEREPEKRLRREITWTGFKEESDTLACALARTGVTKGDKVIQLMTNCIEWLPVYFGILSAGAVAVPLNFRFTGEDIALCCEISEAKVFIFGPEFIERIESIKQDLDRTVSTYVFYGPDAECPDFAVHASRFVCEAPAKAPDVEIFLRDPAGIYFTSGTTGTPKATLLNHRNLEFACYLENRHHNQTHKDNFLCIPPLYHTGAKMHWFGNFIVGARAVILKGVTSEWILEAVSEENVTIVWLLVPWALDILFALESGEVRLKDYQLDQWRLMHIGAQPVPPSLVKEWLSVFPHHQYDTNYGLTESTGPGCVHLGLDNIHKVGAIGKPGFDWEFKIVDAERKPLPAGSPGELMMRGPGVMQEYYKNPRATKDTLIDGWLATGDVARVDEDGFIWLVDRKKDVIITGGENIYPVEIEDFLQAHPDVADAAVIGVPSLRLGELPAAVIKIKPGRELTKEQLTEYCQALPRYKRPRRFFFGDVPRNPTGKIEKPKLRKQYAGIDNSFRV
ncbi:MAG: AMP-binding protein [Desulfatibacillum sp.]|nr:AMP-binding protein [Desulfatibacillum sp.]